MLHTKVDVKCDKLAKVVGRSSQILSTYFDQQTDHQFTAQSVELCQIKLTALCDDQCAAAKFSQYRVLMGAKFSREVTVTRISFKQSPIG